MVVTGTLDGMKTTEPCMRCGKPVDLFEPRHVHKVTGFWEVDNKGRPKKLKARLETVGGAYHWWCWRENQGYSQQDSLF